MLFLTRFGGFIPDALPLYAGLCAAWRYGLIWCLPGHVLVVALPRIYQTSFAPASTGLLVGMRLTSACGVVSVPYLPVFRPEIEPFAIRWQIVTGPPCALSGCVAFNSPVFIVREFYHNGAVGHDAVMLKAASMEHAAGHAVGDVAF